LEVALHRVADLDHAAILHCFREYLDRQGVRITRAQFEKNLARKVRDGEFGRDVPALLEPEIFATLPLLFNLQSHAPVFDTSRAATHVGELLLHRIP
jgi:hypothetical protein